MIDGQTWLGAAGLLLLGVAVGAGLTGVAWLLRGRSQRPQRRPDSGRRSRMAIIIGLAVVGVVAVLSVGRAADPRLTEAVVSVIAARVVSAMPDIVIAVIVLVVALLLGSMGRRLLRAAVQRARPAWAEAAGALAYWLVIAIAVVIAAAQVGLAVGVLERLFLIVAGGIVLTAAIGLGLGSRELVGAAVAGRHVARVVEVGDEIEVDGIRGTVLALGRASARVAVGDAEAEVPNGRFLDGGVLVRQRARNGSDKSIEAPDPLEGQTPTS